MPDIRKLKVILLEKHQDPVHLFLSKTGVVQYIKVDCEEEQYNEFLQACPIPSDESQQNSEIQARIKRKLEELGLTLDDVIDEVALLPGNTIKEILSNIEQKLIEIEEKSSTEEQVSELKRHISLAKSSSIKKSKDSEKNSNKEIPYIDTIHSTLLSLQGMTLKIEVLLEAENDMAYCDTIVYLEAWVLKKQLPKVEEGIKKITNGICVIEQETPKSNENVPNVIKRAPLLFQGFEGLTFSLGYPRKGEINPTYLVAFTFPFLFGIMFADVGQGLILFIGGILFLIKKSSVEKKNKQVGEIFGYLLSGAGIITLCGISAMAFGYIFGEYFGPSGVFHHILLFEIGPFKFGGFDPMHEPLVMLRFAIFIGVIFITFSLFLDVINRLKRGEVMHAFATICWIWFLLGGFFMWVFWGGISQLTSWFGEGMIMFLLLVIAPLITMLIVMAKAESLMNGMNHTVEVFIESLGHTLSFCRLAALFLTHTALSAMFLDLAGVENGVFPLATIPIVVLGTILALAIEGLLVLVHVLRLHWVELLPKFYSAKGILFKPIKIK